MSALRRRDAAGRHGGGNSIASYPAMRVKPHRGSIMEGTMPTFPRAHCEAPFAEWKRIDLEQDALPPRDAGRTAQAGGTITVDEYESKRAAGEA
jgi:hypothetical protein